MRTRNVALTALFALCVFAADAYAGGAVRFRFADIPEGRRLISADDSYTARLGDSGAALRFTKKGVTLADYKAFAADQVRPFTAPRRSALAASADRLNMRFAELGFVNPLTNEVTVVLTTMREEFGASGYTRGSVVFLGVEAVDCMPPRSLDNLLAHELFHVISRQNQEFRRKMYSAIGFTLCEEPKFSDEVRSGILANPDVEKYDCKATFTIDGKPVEATIITFIPDRHVRGRLVLSTVHPAIVPLGEPGRVVSVEDVPDFEKVVGRNTGYVIAAEECIADNFAYAVLVPKEYHKEFPDSAILGRIVSALSAK